MSVTVVKYELGRPDDVSGLKAAFASGQLKPDEIMAVIGKSEGNGGVNDFSRVLADLSFRKALLDAGSRTEAQIAAIPMVWSGGCDGVIAPHVNVFARNGEVGDPAVSRPARCP